MAKYSTSMSRMDSEDSHSFASSPAASIPDTVENISFDPEFRDYKYDMFAGVNYEIDISHCPEHCH